MWLSPLEIGAAQLRSVTETAPKSTVVMCEQNPYLVWFSCQHKSYLVSGYEHLSHMWLSSLEIGTVRCSFARLQKSRRSQPSLCVNRSPIWYGFRASTKAIWYSAKHSLSWFGNCSLHFFRCRRSCLKAVSVWPSQNGEMRHVRKWTMITTKCGSR